MANMANFLLIYSTSRYRATLAVIWDHSFISCTLINPSPIFTLFVALFLVSLTRFLSFFGSLSCSWCVSGVHSVSCCFTLLQTKSQTRTLHSIRRQRTSFNSDRGYALPKFTVKPSDIRLKTEIPYLGCVITTKPST